MLRMLSTIFHCRYRACKLTETYSEYFESGKYDRFIKFLSLKSSTISLWKMNTVLSL